MTRVLFICHGRGKHPFAKWGNIGHNKADGKGDTTDLNTKGARSHV